MVTIILSYLIPKTISHKTTHRLTFFTVKLSVVVALQSTCNLFRDVDIHIDVFIGYLTLIKQEKHCHKEWKMMLLPNCHLSMPKDILT